MHRLQQLVSVDLSNLSLEEQQLADVLQGYQGSLALREYGFDDAAFDRICESQETGRRLYTRTNTCGAGKAGDYTRPARQHD